MKVGTIVLAVVLGCVAVAGAVWVGNYNSQPVETETSDDPEWGPLVGPPPKAVVDEVLFDFGSMEKKTEGEHVFEIRNEGEGILKMLKKKPSCKCTTFKLGDDEETERMELAQGESVKVTVAWKVGGMAPEYRQDAPVYTNDPAMPYIDFVIKGTVVSNYFVHPFRTLTAPDMVGNDPVFTTGAVGSQLHDDFEIDSIEKNSDLFEITPQKLEPEEFTHIRGAKCVYGLEIKISPKIPIGRFQERFTVVLRDKDGKIGKESFEVVTNRDGPITIIGKKFDNPTMTLDLQAFSINDGAAERLTMFVRDSEETEDLYFKVVDSTNEHVKLDIELDKDFKGKSKKYQLNFEIPAGELETGDERGRAEIFVETNHPLLKSIKFRVKYQAY